MVYSQKKLLLAAWMLQPTDPSLPRHKEARRLQYIDIDTPSFRLSLLLNEFYGRLSLGQVRQPRDNTFTHSARGVGDVELVRKVPHHLEVTFLPPGWAPGVCHTQAQTRTHMLRSS
eukprot:GHVR01158481.1.p1 GENE.GHVR01158481.1~~GHVR01158481.1.p1  ORF type:complete len:116 (-),score=12.99 GHVR01158481.1:109-456(-)